MKEDQQRGRSGRPASGRPSHAELFGEIPEGGWSELPVPGEDGSSKPQAAVEPARARNPGRRATLRRAHRYPASFRVSIQTIDPVRDPVTGEMCFQASEDDCTVDVSRLGLRLRAERAPSVGTRLLLRVHVPEEPRALEFVGRTCWTRVELERGPVGRRAVCGVGIELLGGSRRSLDRYDHLLDELRAQSQEPVAEG